MTTRNLTSAGLAILAMSMGLATAVAGDALLDGDAAYHNGDYAMALRLLRPLANQGDGPAQAVAQGDLGLMYYNGEGVPQDYAKAAEWFRRSAEQGFLGAQYNLAVMYSRGESVPRDYAEAVKWYRKAAERRPGEPGLAAAQNNLGLMYYSGQGVPQDYAEAIKWYRMAADQGHAKALYNLGFMYANGQGVLRDYVQAYKWASVAATRFAASEKENQEEVAAFRDKVAKLMTADQIAEAQRLASEWHPAVAGRAHTDLR